MKGSKYNPPPLTLSHGYTKTVYVSPSNSEPPLSATYAASIVNENKLFSSSWKPSSTKSITLSSLLITTTWSLSTTSNLYLFNLFSERSESHSNTKLPQQLGALSVFVGNAVGYKEGARVGERHSWQTVTSAASTTVTSIETKSTARLHCAWTPESPGHVTVGDRVGSYVGEDVGNAVGTWLGYTVGTADGESVGANVGYPVGEKVGTSVGASVLSVADRRIR
jgi:hypothetical protein